MDYNDFHEQNVSAWGGTPPTPPKEEYPEPVENKTRLGQINDLLDEYIDQKKAIKEVKKGQGGNNLLSSLNKRIVEIENKLNKLK